MKKALVFGAFGQDGRLLTKLLLGKGYSVLCVGRHETSLAPSKEIWAPFDYLDAGQVAETVLRFAPDEIYYLAAYHHSSESPETLNPGQIWKRSVDVHCNGLVNFLEAVRLNSLPTRLFYSASSLVFGSDEPAPQTEQTPMRPECVYGITKAAGVSCCDMYAREHSVFACSGFLYNHESGLRPDRFVSQKIIKAANEIASGTEKELILGDLAARADWGYAPDYVDAFQRILQLDRPENFIIATGQPHCVQDWVETAFGELGLDWTKHVRQESRATLRNNNNRIGDISKLKTLTGWTPNTSFHQMVKAMLGHEDESNGQ